jgi:protoporphyrin/coproporphyrin ferrochelatase
MKMRVSAVVVVACIASHEHSVNGFALSSASGRLAARQSAISQSMTRQRSSCSAQRCSMAASAHSSSSSSEHRLTTMQAAAASAAADANKPLRLGVLLMNLGGPERLEHVEPFLYNLFVDPDIIRLPALLSPLQSTLASVLSKRRAPKSRAAYASIGGGSPIVRWTNAQAAAIEASLAVKGLPGSKCYVAMRYWHPFSSEAIEEMKADGITAAVVLPLYPQFSISTSGSSLRALQEELSKDPEFAESLTHTVVPSWHDR